MMRMRGDDYVGRFDSPEDELENFMAEHPDHHHDDSHDDSSNPAAGHHMILVNDPRAVVSSAYSSAGASAINGAPSVEAFSHSSLLEQILKNASEATRRSPSPNTPLSTNTHYVTTASLGSGGTVMDVSKYADSAAMVLTPPPSVSGDSLHPRSARSTPPESAYSSFDAAEQDQAIDLTTSKPVILGHRDSRVSSGASSPEAEVGMKVEVKMEMDEDLAQLERDAAHTLLFLSRGGA